MRLITTLGDLAQGDLGPMLPHEHVFVDFRTPDQIGYGEADTAEVIALMAPEIERIKAQGLRAMVDCTPVGVGRRVDLLLALSRATDFPIVAPTGIYREPWVPAWALAASEQALCDWMSRELIYGVEQTGVRAAWVKLSAGDDGMSAQERKILRAGARAAAQVNAVIGSHTVRGSVVHDQLNEIEQVGYTASRYIWIHASADPDFALNLAVARRGAWIEYRLDRQSGRCVFDRSCVAHVGRRFWRANFAQPGSWLVRPGASTWHLTWVSKAVYLSLRCVFAETKRSWCERRDPDAARPTQSV